MHKVMDTISIYWWTVDLGFTLTHAQWCNRSTLQSGRHVRHAEEGTYPANSGLVALVALLTHPIDR